MSKAKREMKDAKAEAARKPEGAASTDGIRIDKKTIIGISALLVAIIVFAGVLTRVIPRGEYTTFTDPETGTSSITADSVYTPLEDYKIPLKNIILSPIMVFVDAETRETGLTGVLIVAFIILMGGTFLLLDKCGVMKYLIALIIHKFGKRKYLMMGIIVFALMALASAAGTLEESVTLVPMAAAVALALGWDSLTGVGMSLVAVAFGFTAATFNPFNVMTVQKIAGDVAIYSGLWLRLVTFAVVYGVLMLFLVMHAKKVEKHPEKSPSYESDTLLRDKYKIDDVNEVFADKRAGKATKGFGICLALAFVCIVLDFVLSVGGTLSMGGLAVFFLLGGIIAAKITGFSAKETAKGFFGGIKTIAPAIPLVFFIISIAYILNKGRIMHTILNYVYGLMDGISPFAVLLIIFAFIALLEFFIGSGTAKAFLVMPLVLPLARLLGVSTNSVVLSFCLADGFTNLLYPTSGIMIIAIGIIGVSYGKWLKYSWKLFVMEGIAAALLMLLAVKTGYC